MGFRIEGGKHGRRLRRDDGDRSILRPGVRFVAGPAVNIYNQHTLALLARRGLRRWVMPFELSRTTLAEPDRVHRPAPGHG